MPFIFQSYKAAFVSDMIIILLLALITYYLAVTLKMFPYSNSLLDQAVQIFWDIRCKTQSLQDSQNLVTSDVTNLSDTMRISKDNACRNVSITL
jgi:hypothetical protein